MFVKSALALAAIAVASIVAVSGVQAHGYHGKHHHYGNDFAYERKCVAVAKRGAGYGRPIRTTRRVGHAYKLRKACRRAMRKCIRALDHRQAHGRNPFAACVVVRRI